MGREHDHDRAFVSCTDCDRPVVARLIESADEPYWQPVGLANRGCPDCGNDEFEEIDPP